MLPRQTTLNRIQSYSGGYNPTQWHDSGLFPGARFNFDLIDIGTMHEACAVQAITPSDAITSSDEVRDESDPPNVNLSKTDLAEAKKNQFRDLLMEYRCVFANSISELSMANTPHHEIDVGDARPIKFMLFRVPTERREFIKKYTRAG